MEERAFTSLDLQTVPRGTLLDFRIKATLSTPVAEAHCTSLLTMEGHGARLGRHDLIICAQ